MARYRHADTKPLPAILVLNELYTRRRKAEKVIEEIESLTRINTKNDSSKLKPLGPEEEIPIAEEEITQLEELSEETQEKYALHRRQGYNHSNALIKSKYGEPKTLVEAMKEANPKNFLQFLFQRRLGQYTELGKARAEKYEYDRLIKKIAKHVRIVYQLDLQKQAGGKLTTVRKIKGLGITMIHKPLQIASEFLARRNGSTGKLHEWHERLSDIKNYRQYATSIYKQLISQQANEKTRIAEEENAMQYMERKLELQELLKAIRAKRQPSLQPA